MQLMLQNKNEGHINKAECCRLQGNEVRKQKTTTTKKLNSRIAINAQ